MNGRLARAIRKQVYGEDKSPRYRKYYLDRNSQRGLGGTVEADTLRQRYQKIKQVLSKTWGGFK